MTEALRDRIETSGQCENPIDKEVPQIEQDGTKPRLEWSGTIEYLLNVIGFNVGLGNLWRFPYLCFKNGGGAFLIPYLISATVIGLPMLFMETAVGQFTQSGCIGSWDLVPLLRGAGYSGLMICWYFISYIMVVMGWILFYFAHSVTLGDLPWATCDNAWNTEDCIPVTGVVGSHEAMNQSSVKYVDINITIISNQTTTSTGEFWNNYVLRQTAGIHDMGSFTNWKMIICFILSWMICYLCVWNGIKTTGKVAYVTVISPYVMLLVLLIRGAMLKGAREGVVYFIYPRLEELAKPQVWLDAAGQVLYTLGVSSTVLHGLGSYNKFNTDCYKNAFICVATSCGSSVFAGFVIFCYLGHVAHVQNKNITDIAEQGPGLVFEVFPAGLTLLPGSQIWAAIFFITLGFIAVDSAFGAIEGITRLLEDIRPKWIVSPGIQTCRFGMCLFPFFLGLPMLFDGGVYVFELVNMYGTSSFCIMLVAFCEVAGIAWIYGMDKFFDDVKSMIGYYPNVLLKYCMIAVDPCVIVVILFVACVQYAPLKLGEYEYPPWAEVVGWIVSLTVLLPIPLFAAKSMLKGREPVTQRWYATTSVLSRRRSNSQKVEMKTFT